MASVARGHDGDGAGDPPVPYWKPESGCLASGQKLRSYAKNLELERQRTNNGAPLDIDFDIYDQLTFLPVGTYAKQFKALVGTLARSVPYYYSSWEHVPAEKKAHVWPCLEYFFNLRPFIHERPPRDVIRLGVKNGVDQQFLKSYRNAKARFKGTYFASRGGSENEDAIRGQPPSNMDPRDWKKHVDYYMSEGAQRLSEVNTKNRKNQVDIATQGRRSYAERRQDFHGPVGAYPSLFASWAQNHQHKDGSWISSKRAKQHAAMLQRWDNSRNSANPPSEEEIVTRVLGKKSGHRRGIGRIVPGLGSSGHSSSDSGPSATSQSGASSSGSAVQRSLTQADMLQMEARLQQQLREQAQKAAEMEATIQSQQSTMTEMTHMINQMRSQGFNFFHQPQPTPPPQPQPPPSPYYPQFRSWNDDELGLEINNDGDDDFDLNDDDL